MAAGRGKPKRTPVHPVPAPVRGKRVSKAPKLDPLEEYRLSLLNDTDIVKAMRLSDDDCLARIRRHISTRSLALDRLLNGLGVPCGRVMEVFGAPHMGKSTILDQVFAQVQTEGGVAVLIDPETSRDIKYSTNLGVDPDKLQYLKFDDRVVVKDKDGKSKKSSEPGSTTIEAVAIALHHSINWWKTHYPDTPVVFGWDALGSTKTREENNKEFDVKKSPGAAARVMRLFQRTVIEPLGNTNIALIIINHEYEKLSLGGGSSFVGPKKETYGGMALRLMATIRLQLYSAGEWIKRSDGSITGKFVTAKLIKNRLGPSPVEANFALLNGTGTNNVIEVYERFRQAGYIKVSGSWSALNLEGNVINFQGWAGLQAKCQEDPALFQKLVQTYWQIQ